MATLLCWLYRANAARGGPLMADEKRTARNRNLFTRMGATPTKAQILAEIDLEISDAINLAAAADFPALLRLLRTAKAEVVELRGAT
jgi:hypothetical protein